MSPADFRGAGREEVLRYGGSLVEGEVQSLEPEFEAALADGSLLRARRVLIATGLTDILPDISGARDRWGRDLLHCPYCHGYEVRGQPLGVLGGTAEAVQHALLLRQWSPDVVIFPGGKRLDGGQLEALAARGVAVAAGELDGLVIEGDRLIGIRLRDGTVVERSAVFVRPSLLPNDQLLGDLGCVTDGAGWVVRDASGRTTNPGVWVAGNAANPRAQVISAAGEGSAAAIAINADLVDEDVAAAIAARRSVKSRPTGPQSNIHHP